MVRHSLSGDSSGSGSPPSSPSKRTARKLSETEKQVIMSLSLGGKKAKEIAAQLDLNYRTVWGILDKCKKGKEMSYIEGGDPKQAAFVLKMAGWKTKDIADHLKINYRTCWGYFNKLQNACPASNLQSASAAPGSGHQKISTDSRNHGKCKKDISSDDDDEDDLEMEIDQLIDDTV